MAAGAEHSDGHGRVPSNHEQDYNTREGVVRGQVPRGGRPTGSSVLATGRVHPADTRNLINPTPNTSADAQVMTDVTNVRGVVIAATPLGNLVAHIQAGVGVIDNAGGPLVGPHNAVVAPAPATDVANVGGVVIAATPRGNPVAQRQARVGVVANADGPLIGPHNAGVVPAGTHNAGLVPAGQAPARLNLGGAAAIVAPALAQPYFDIEAGLSGPPLRRSEVGPFF